MEKIKVIELCSGLGSQTEALKRLGIPHENPYAVQGSLFDLIKPQEELYENWQEYESIE